jgi:GT2 family glycosyltransferase
MTHIPILLAIPHYNAPAQLDSLLADVSSDTCDRVVVLDDHSDDTAALERLQQKYPQVEFILGDKNLGSGGNRNRVMTLDFDGIVWFLDCDMKLITTHTAQTLRKIFRSNDRQMIGGQLLARDGSPMVWNYAHEMHPVHDALFEEIRSNQANVFSKLIMWQKLQSHGWDYPWLHGKPVLQPRRVDWVAEGSFALPLKLFRNVGGYDEAFRYHEGQDLAKRVRDAGARVSIRPEIVTRHLEVDVTKARRDDDREASKFLFFKKHWGMSREVYDALYDK